jgi:hypothetical protein
MAIRQKTTEPTRHRRGSTRQSSCGIVRGMNRVAFDWDPRGSHAPGELRVLIDGRSLDELVRTVELPYATAEGHPQIAGAYRGIHPRQLHGSIREHLMGGPGSDLACGPADKTVLLGCECGEIGCWPLMARVEVRDGEIVWRDFQQPHRTGTWSYQDLDEFVFDRAQYETAIDQAEGALGRPPATTP